MKKERYAFTVIHQAADFVMEEKLLPTADGHTLSFVGGEAREQDSVAKCALTHLHKRLGFTALEESHLGKPKVVTYNDKIGYFFKLLIPSDTEIKAVQESSDSTLILKKFDEVLDAVRDQTMLELSSLYAERKLM